MPKTNQTAAVAAALALATATANTAQELAKAKVDSDVTSAILTSDIGRIKLDIAEIRISVKTLSDRDNQYVLKEDFCFWRNILVSGLLLSIAIASILSIMNP